MSDNTQESLLKPGRRLPDWMRKTAGDQDAIRDLKVRFRGQKLHTVCEEARCPNMGECWSRGIATFMILGDVCTRSCRFCAIKSGRPEQAPDPQEPAHIAEQVAHLRLNHVVITSVARDDLPDEGAEHFAHTVRAIHDRSPNVTVEVLVPDFHARADCLAIVGASQPEIFNHNMETVRRLTPSIRSKARYDRSLQVLADYKRVHPTFLTKSGIMVGLGETPDEVETVMRDLRAIDCGVLTIGQYLQPTFQHHPVVEYVTPEQFVTYQTRGQGLGFTHVFSGPFVRSSYMAEEQFISARRSA